MAEQKQKTEDGFTLADLYNVLMETIEPDLALYNIGALDEIYKDEAPEDRKARFERYKDSFKKCMEKMDEAIGLWKRELNVLKGDILSAIEKKSLKKDKDDISGLEQSISKS